MATKYMTLDDVINTKDRYDINKISFFTTTEDRTLVIQDTNLMTTYLRYLQPYIMRFTVSKAHRQYYRFRPDLLSNDLYDTPNLSWLLLMLNNQECASKFRIKSYIKIIPYEYLANIYDTIITKSTDKLNTNWNTYLLNVSTTDDPLP